jgi:death-on-curing protein
LDFIKYPVFGHDPYPSLVEKAAYLLSFIIDRYPFADGNKRSATATAAYFLEKNGYILELHGREGAMLALDIGDSKITFDQVVAWVSRHIVPK